MIMQRLKGRSIVLVALAALACSGDPTGNEGTPTAIIANPDVVFVTQGDSQAVLVSVIDEEGQVLQTDVSASNVGSGITVSLDPTFQAVNTPTPIGRQSRFFVKGVDLTATTFTLNALGLTKTVQVTSVPGILSATVSDSLPALGDTITITAPTGTFFTENSVLTFSGAAPVVVSQDATQITFIPFPNIAGPGVVSDVGVTSNPALTFDLATPFRVKTDSIFDIGTAVTPTTPALGGAVTLTLPADLRLLPESLVSLNIANQPVLPRDAVLSADSTTITFVPPPNADSFVVLNGVVHRNLPQYPLTLNTTVKVTTPVIDSVPSTVSDATPDVGQPVTLNAGGGFTFSPSSQVVVGADTATTSAVAGDGSSITFFPTPGIAGAMTVTDVGIAGFAIPLPSTAGTLTPNVTVVPIPGTGAPGSAPILQVPDAGITRGFVDKADAPGYADCGDPNGNIGLPCQIYKFVVPALDTLTFTATWGNQSDVGIYFLESDAATSPAFDTFDCDAHGNTVNDPAGPQPETCTYIIPAGTYFLAVVGFGPFYPASSGGPEAYPPWVKLRVDH
jgi:hypothetical protein